jgi:hypothetical protein
MKGEDLVWDDVRRNVDSTLSLVFGSFRNLPEPFGAEAERTFQAILAEAIRQGLHDEPEWQSLAAKWLRSYIPRPGPACALQSCPPPQRYRPPLPAPSAAVLKRSFVSENVLVTLRDLVVLLILWLTTLSLFAYAALTNLVFGSEP